MKHLNIDFLFKSYYNKDKEIVWNYETKNNQTLSKTFRNRSPYWRNYPCLTQTFKDTRDFL